MISLLYVSRAALQLGREDRQLMEILETARERNARGGITGALIYMGGHFAQVLEGEAPAVNQLMIDILRDRRHGGIRIIELVSIPKRRFANWSMASVPPSPGPLSWMEALTGHDADVDPSAATLDLIDYMAKFAEGPE